MYYSFEQLFISIAKCKHLGELFLICPSSSPMLTQFRHYLASLMWAKPHTFCIEKRLLRLNTCLSSQEHLLLFQGTHILLLASVLGSCVKKHTITYNSRARESDIAIHKKRHRHKYTQFFSKPKHNYYVLYFLEVHLFTQ